MFENSLDTFNGNFFNFESFFFSKSKVKQKHFNWEKNKALLYLLETFNLFIHGKHKTAKTAAKAQSVQQSIPTPEVHSSNPVISKFHIKLSTVGIQKIKIEKKRPGMALFKKPSLDMGGVIVANDQRDRTVQFITISAILYFTHAEMFGDHLELNQKLYFLWREILGDTIKYFLLTFDDFLLKPAGHTVNSWCSTALKPA